MTPTPNSKTEEKLEEIAMYLARMDRRDHRRAIGENIRNILTVVPIVFFLFGMWYLATHMDEIIRNVSRNAAESSMEYSEERMGDLMEQFRQMGQ